MIDTMANIAVGVLSLMALATLGMMYRNLRVHGKLMELLNLVSNAAKDDIDHEPRRGPGGIGHFTRVSYNRMVFEFWKPVRTRSWWDDTSFITRGGEEPKR
jgi:hypothetical protein